MVESMSIHFWGVRGSHPVPGKETVIYGGNTACVEVRIRNHTIILDAGTGIIAMGRELLRRTEQSGTPANAILLFSHLHHDHTQGLPFFAPAFIPSTRLHLLGPGIYDLSVREILARVITPPEFPISFKDLAAQITISDLQETDRMSLGRLSGSLKVLSTREGIISADQVGIQILRSYAHPGGVFTYRIDWGGKSVVYATDVEGYVGADRRLIAFSQGADLLIHDAQYTADHYRGLAPGLLSTQGFGHSTSEIACEVARSAGVKRLVLFHHDPGYDDATIAEIEANAQALFHNTQAASEGMEINLEYSSLTSQSSRLSKKTYDSEEWRKKVSDHPEPGYNRSRRGTTGKSGRLN